MLDIFDVLVMHRPITEFTPRAGYVCTEESDTFTCNDFDWYSFLSHGALGGERVLWSDILG